MGAKVKKNVLKNKRGVASIEAVAMLVIFVLFMSYGVGMFGVIHTGILNSIAARTYAWETFNHRTNVVLFRDNRDYSGGGMPITYYPQNWGFRVHSIASEYADKEEWIATERTIAMGRELDTQSTRNSGTHGRLKQTTKRERIGVNPVWIKTIYGICLDATCGTVNL